MDVDNNSIQKLYIEPSTLCNLDCTMCMRRSWDDEPMGLLDMDIFYKVMDEVKNIPSINTVFFGGVGEPTYHPHFLEMVEQAHAAGKRVECVSNGTLLDYAYSEALAKAGMNQIWISVDGFTKESYEDIRRNGNFALVKNNMLNIYAIRRNNVDLDFHLGLSFVAMKSNIGEMAKLMGFAWDIHAKDVKITHILPYTEESVEEALYTNTLMFNEFRQNSVSSMDLIKYEGHGMAAHLDFPLFDIDENTLPALARLLKAHGTYSIMGSPLARKTDYCRFVQEGNVFVKWDGSVTQCMALLHPSVSYLYGQRRTLDAHSFGSLKDNTLQEIWDDEEYTCFREKVREFNFSMCTHCCSCNLVESNREDCIGNKAPTCGGCLWAQGFIQCP